MFQGYNESDYIKIQDNLSPARRLFSVLHDFVSHTRTECLLTLHMAILHIGHKETVILTREEVRMASFQIPTLGKRPQRNQG